MEEEQPQESQTGGEIPQKLEDQPTQMFIAKKRDEESFTAEKKTGWKEKLKNFWIECKRVLKVTKKPDSFEFKTIVKVSALGILLIGLIGFIISMAKELLL
jgi:protein transport protein SEC61 subunit gamma-like protein